MSNGKEGKSKKFGFFSTLREWLYGGDRGTITAIYRELANVDIITFKMWLANRRTNKLIDQFNNFYELHKDRLPGKYQKVEKHKIKLF